MNPAGDNLPRSLQLRHVFALSTGAMVSSGLFLLPGLAAAEAGPAAVLAYAVAGVLVIPAMLSVAELSTAMPRAGGAYYFLERALGPAVGTVAGLGTWLSLVLKDAFALIGMSAYLNLVVDVPSKPLALLLIAFFTVLNIFGSRLGADVQLVLVSFVFLVMTAFLLAGLPRLGSGDGSLAPFFDAGVSGLIGVIGLVFVSYGGLTKVASVAEEIEDPSRNIPLGMALSLLASTMLYVLAVLVTIAVVPIDTLANDQAPIHTAAEAVMPALGAVLVVIAALAAFSSAVNAGILAAGRYPLAMSRDGLLNSVFQKVTPAKTPLWGIIVTGLGMALVVVAFDVEAIAKLASAFVLLTMALVNLAVIVLRASHIRSYAPGFRSPLYPGLQVVGLIVTTYLIIELGPLALTLVATSIVVALLWYWLYGRARATRVGAIYHVFQRWGQAADPALDREISQAMQSHGLRPEDAYPGLIARAAVISVPDGADIDEAARRSSEVLGRRVEMDSQVITDRFLETGSLWIQPSQRHPTAIPVAFLEVADEHLVICRSPSGVTIPERWGGRDETVFALFFLIGRSDATGTALRLAGELAAYLNAETGLAMIDASFESEVKTALLPELDIEQYPLLTELPAGQLVGRRVGDLEPPIGIHLEAVRRNGRVIPTKSDLVFEDDDQLTVIGPSGGLPDADRLVDLLTKRDDPGFA